MHLIHTGVILFGVEKERAMISVFDTNPVVLKVMIVMLTISYNGVLCKDANGTS